MNASDSDKRATACPRVGIPSAFIEVLFPVRTLFRFPAGEQGTDQRVASGTAGPNMRIGVPYYPVRLQRLGGELRAISEPTELRTSYAVPPNKAPAVRTLKHIDINLTATQILRMITDQLMLFILRRLPGSRTD